MAALQQSDTGRPHTRVELVHLACFFQVLDFTFEKHFNVTDVEQTDRKKSGAI